MSQKESLVSQKKIRLVGGRIRHINQHGESGKSKKRANGVSKRVLDESIRRRDG